MARLYRPTIPVEVKCRVALRHLGEIRYIATGQSK